MEQLCWHFCSMITYFQFQTFETRFLWWMYIGCCTIIKATVLTLCKTLCLYMANLWAALHGLLGTAHMCICKHAGCHAPRLGRMQQWTSPSVHWMQSPRSPCMFLSSPPLNKLPIMYKMAPWLRVWGCEDEGSLFWSRVLSSCLRSLGLAISTTVVLLYYVTACYC